MYLATLAILAEQFPTFESHGNGENGGWNAAAWDSYPQGQPVLDFNVWGFGYDWPKSYVGEPTVINFVSRLNGQVTILPGAGEKVGDPVVVKAAVRFDAKDDAPYRRALNERVFATASFEGRTLLDASVEGEFGQQTFSANDSVLMKIGDTFTAQYVMEVHGNAGDLFPSYWWLGPEGNIRYTLSLAPPPKPDLIAKSLGWNTTEGGVDFSYEVASGEIDKDSTVALYWASGTTFADKIGNAVHSVSAQKAIGYYGPFYVTAQELGKPPAAATRLLLVVDDKEVVSESDEQNNVLAAGADVIATSLEWNPKAGGVTLRYEIRGVDLPKSPVLDVALYWANGPAWQNAISRIPIRKGIHPQSKAGSYSTHVRGSDLQQAPPETSHILLVVDPQNVFSEGDETNNTRALEDVVVNYQPDAKQVLSAYTEGIIMDALRYAGQSSGVVTSTYRTPREQAQAMYNNILRGTSPKYGPAGTAVINAYKAALATYKKAKKKDPTTPVPDYVSIMEAKIINVGPGKVSKHCWDFSVLQVVDISYKRITNKALFHRAIISDSRISKVLDPFNSKDPAFHIEVPQQQQNRAYIAALLRR